MLEIINKNDRQSLANKLKRIRERSVALDAQLMNDVAEIIKDVRTRGDVALIEYASRFDGVTLTQSELRVDELRLRQASTDVDEGFLAALRESIANVRAFHEQQR